MVTGRGRGGRVARRTRRAASPPAPRRAAAGGRRAAPWRRRVPPRKRAISSRLRCVADSPMRCSGRPTSALEPLERQRQVRAALGRARARGSRRRSPCRPTRSRSRAFDVSSRNSDSGVVIRMSAGSRWKRARSAAGVSPVRIDIVGTWKAHAGGRGDVRDAGQRRPQVALDVHRQRLERREVQHAAAGVARRHRREHQPVEARTGTRSASCRCRSARGSASTRRARSPASPGVCGRVGAAKADANHVATGAWKRVRTLGAIARYNASDVRAAIGGSDDG